MAVFAVDAATVAEPEAFALRRSSRWAQEWWQTWRAEQMVADAPWYRKRAAKRSAAKGRLSPLCTPHDAGWIRRHSAMLRWMLADAFWLDRLESLTGERAEALSQLTELSLVLVVEDALTRRSPNDDNRRLVSFRIASALNQKAGEGQ